MLHLRLMNPLKEMVLLDQEALMGRIWYPGTNVLDFSQGFCQEIRAQWDACSCWSARNLKDRNKSMWFTFC